MTSILLSLSRIEAVPLGFGQYLCVLRSIFLKGRHTLPGPNMQPVSAVAKRSMRVSSTPTIYALSQIHGFA